MSLIIDKNIKILVQYYNYYTYIFGLQKIKLVNGKFFKVEKFYKLYAFIFMMVLVYYNLCGLKHKYDIKYKQKSVPFIITIIIFYSSTLIGYIIIMINSIFFSQEIYEKILSTISKVNNRLGLDENDEIYSKNLKMYITIVHILYFIFKTICTIIDYMTFTSPYAIYLQSLMTGLDLEIIHFVVELNIVSRLFERVNSELKYFSTCPIDMKNGILFKIWSKNKTKSNFIHCDKTEKRLIELLKSYDELVDVIFHLNSHYKITVHMIILVIFQV